MCSRKLYSLRTVFVLYILSVKVVCSGKKFTNDLPLGRPQLRNLAEEICYDLFLENVSIRECQRRFIKPESKYLLEDRPPEASVLCQDMDSVTLSLSPPSSHHHLLIMLPNDTDAFPIYRILQPSDTLTSVTLDPFSYDIFTTTLGANGERGIWEIGPAIAPSHPGGHLDTNIDIRIVNLVHVGGDIENAYDATFSWNATAYECEFDVINKCGSANLGNFIRKRIKFGSEKAVKLPNLPLGDDCIIEVRSSSRNGTLEYKTPDCYQEDNIDICKPEYAKNVSIYASEAESGQGYNINVRWMKPKNEPNYYKLALTYDQEIVMNVSGSETNATFHNVDGHGMFYVTITAVYPIRSSVVNRKGEFPKPNWMSPLAIFAGAGVLSLLAAFVATTFVYVRRLLRDRRVHLYFPECEEKVAKKLEDDGWVHTVKVSEDGWEMQPERLVLHQVVGEGAFGVVRKGTLMPEGKEVAVKMLKEFPSIEEVRSFRSEMDLMKVVGSHSHVVSLIGCCSGRRPCIVAEYCSRGDLLKYLRCAWDIMITKSNVTHNNNEEDPCNKLESKSFANKVYYLDGVCDSELSAVDLLSFCRQIAMGMEFLASNRIVHRDLAARNILVCGDKTLKIADFGLSRDVYQDSLYKQRGNGKLPVKWMAIESLTHRLYTTQSDVWSYGVVMWEIVTLGGAPYPDVEPVRLTKLLKAGYRMPRPSNCTQAFYEVILSCWNCRPRERPSFSDLHSRLDCLLHTATADDYITVHIDYEDSETIKQEQCKTFLTKNILSRWTISGEVYEKPLKADLKNHYITSPDIIRTQ